MKTSSIYNPAKTLRPYVIFLLTCLWAIFVNAQSGSLRLIGTATYDLNSGYLSDSSKMVWLGNFGGDEDHTADVWKYTYRESLTRNHTSTASGYKTLITYDANNQAIGYTYIDWDGSAYQNRTRITDSFDVLGRKVQEIQENWTSGAWVTTSKSIDSFDINNHVINTNLFTFNTGTNQWSLSRITTQAYNAAGKRTLYQQIYWNGSAWVNYEQLIDVFDSNNKLVTETEATGSGSVWVNSSRLSYQYDINGDESVYTRYEWNTSTASWKNIWRDLFNNTSFHKWADWTHQTYSTTWDNAFKYYFTYNSANLTETSMRQLWISAAWVNSDQAIQHYNSNGFQTELRNQFWDGFTWNDTTRQTNTRNNNDQSTMQGKEKFASGAWSTSSEKYYYYEPYAPTTGIDNVAEISSIKAYPNPFTQNCMIEFNSENAGEHTLQVFDLSGKLIREIKAYYPAGGNSILFDGNDMEGEQLAKGLYVMQITCNGARAAYKLCKQ